VRYQSCKGGDDDVPGHLSNLGTMLVAEKTLSIKEPLDKVKTAYLSLMS